MVSCGAGGGGHRAAPGVGVGVVLAVRARGPSAGARRPAGRPPRRLHPIPGALGPTPPPYSRPSALGERLRRPRRGKHERVFNLAIVLHCIISWCMLDAMQYSFGLCRADPRSVVGGPPTRAGPQSGVAGPRTWAGRCSCWRGTPRAGRSAWCAPSRRGTTRSPSSRSAPTPSTR